MFLKLIWWIVGKFFGKLCVSFGQKDIQSHWNFWNSGYLVLFLMSFIQHFRKNFQLFVQIGSSLVSKSFFETSVDHNFDVSFICIYNLVVGMLSKNLQAVHNDILNCRLIKIQQTGQTHVPKVAWLFRRFIQLAEKVSPKTLESPYNSKMDRLLTAILFLCLIIYVMKEIGRWMLNVCSVHLFERKKKL